MDCFNALFRYMFGFSGFLLGSSSLVILLVFLEILSWLFAFFFSCQLCMKYLFIQSYFVILMLISILWAPPLVFLSVLFKVGLPPFHSWLLHFANTLPLLSFIFMSTLHKLVPLVLLSKSASLLVFFLLLMVSSLLLLQSSLFFYVLIFSSMIHSMWMILSFTLSKSFAISYWAIYCSVILALTSACSLYKSILLMLGQSSLTMISWLVVSGIPPFSLFWLKTNLFVSLIEVSLCWSALVVFSSVMALSVYFWAFHLSLMGSSAFNFNWAFFGSFVLFLSFLTVS